MVAGDQEHVGDQQRQPKWGIIFRGTGTRISKEEKCSYHPDVPVFWQKNAWQDEAVTHGLVETCAVDYLKQQNFLEEGKPWLLEWDSVWHQKCSHVVGYVESRKGSCFYGTPQKSHGWQTIDCGSFGALAKAILGEVHEEWLDIGQNQVRWEENKISPKESRVLMTHFIAEVRVRFYGDKYKNARLKAVSQTGLNGEMLALKYSKHHVPAVMAAKFVVA